MCFRVLITGSAGLIGKALYIALEELGVTVVGLDLLGQGVDAGDIRDTNRVAASVEGCDGVIHLAAVSRVILGERDPIKCWETNVGGLNNVIKQLERFSKSPWLIFASSREVYGQAKILPATESSPLQPVNVYGCSKLEGEMIVNAARTKGIRTAIVRFSNVYGSTCDHPDRVVPAFAKAATTGGRLRVDGVNHTFDFTHLDDVVHGILALVDRLQHGEYAPPPIHFVTGKPTTLGQLAALAVGLGGGSASITYAPPRTFDISHFYGSPERAMQLLGWVPRISLIDGLAKLINDFKAPSS